MSCLLKWVQILYCWIGLHRRPSKGPLTTLFCPFLAQRCPNSGHLFKISIIELFLFCAHHFCLDQLVRQGKLSLHLSRSFFSNAFLIGITVFSPVAGMNMSSPACSLHKRFIISSFASLMSIILIVNGSHRLGCGHFWSTASQLEPSFPSHSGIPPYLSGEADVDADCARDGCIA